MNMDRLLRQRAEELRQQLRVTIRQTHEAIISTRKLTDELARRSKREALDRSLALTAENLCSSQEKLDAFGPL